jgi:thymidylate synthase
MHLIERNVNEAFHDLVKRLAYNLVPTEQVETRNGPVLAVRGPVLLTYTHPTERVLFNRARDCNPFFHLYESLWMLAGRNDVAPLAYYNRRIAQYSDDGVTFNAAYGYRWRRALVWDWEYGEGPDPRSDEVDQLAVIGDHLRRTPNSRRALLQMWNVADDLLKVETSKDIACNTHAYFHVDGSKLNITVCNRSNDLVWGMLGANAVQFSILLEYMAARCGREVGHYHHFTNDLHCYPDTWNPAAYLSSGEHGDGCYEASPYRNGLMSTVHLLPHQDVDHFDRECAVIIEINDGCGGHYRRYYGGPDDPRGQVGWTEPFLQLVAHPLFAAWHCYKAGRLDVALDWADSVAADDWRLAATNWIRARIERRAGKKEVTEGE